MKERSEDEHHRNPTKWVKTFGRFRRKEARLKILLQFPVTTGRRFTSHSARRTQGLKRS
jgi:chlorite dismutase